MLTVDIISVEDSTEVLAEHLQEKLKTSDSVCLGESNNKYEWMQSNGDERYVQSMKL